MTDRSSDEDLSRLVAELVRSLRELEEELAPPDRRRPPLPTPQELRRFTSEVAIPGLILVLETNIRALRLLQRALEMGERAEDAQRSADELRERATTLSATTLDRLDDALADLQTAVEGRPDSDEAAALLADARELRQEVQDRLAESREPETDTVESTESDESTEAAPEVDVDAELRSIKDELDDAEGPEDNEHPESDDGSDQSDNSSPDDDGE
jgi:hypothetical protein